MSIQEKNLPFRGDVKALVSSGKDLFWVTQHPQKQPTSVCRLSLETDQLVSIPLPCGAVSLFADEQTVWIGGDDAKLYRLETKDKTASSFAELPGNASGIATAADRIAITTESKLLLVDVKGKNVGKIVQEITLQDVATAMEVDPTGQWIVVGLASGVVQVFESEGKPEFLPSESEKLHTGSVTALLFEPEELRFFSSGQDLKLLLTHARGKLEPEDRGRSAMHEELIVSIVHAPGGRLITGSRDKTCKSWTRAGATKPSTLAEGLVAVVSLATIEIHARPHLAVACSDNSIRLFLLDAGGRFGTATHRYNDAYELASKLLSHQELAQRSEGLKTLASFDDDRSIEMLKKYVESEKDHGLRLQAAQLMVAATCPLAKTLLQPLLKNADGAVRLVAFDGLYQRLGDQPLEPISLALKAEQADIGIRAIEKLVPLAKVDSVAWQDLTTALEHSLPQVRITAQLKLEEVCGQESPEANLLALASKQADTRKLALIRLMQRRQLQDRRVQSALRRAGEDGDAEVRRNAFLVTLLSDADLAGAVRALDDTIHRQLQDLENMPATLEGWLPTTGKTRSSESDVHSSEVADQSPVSSEASTDEVTEEPAQEPARGKGKGKKTGAIAARDARDEMPSKSKVELSSAQLAPLLSAMASRASDTSLRGACALAALRDPRALAILLQLSREQDARTRSEVCSALMALGDSQSLQRLESMLDDSEATVRDAAYSGFAWLTSETPLKAATAGMLSTHEDVRRRALTTLISFLRKLGKTKGEKSDGEQVARQLLIRALNDGTVSVRKEAFKTALSLELDGGADATLRFVLQSVHADIRREVLTEVIAQAKQPWAAELLQLLFSDPDQEIRKEAFEHATSKSKGRDLAPLQAALSSKFPDTRLQAVEAIKRLGTAESQTALAGAMNDDDRFVRHRALNAIIEYSAVEQSAAGFLQQAMTSKHDDVRLNAACIRANVGDPTSLTVLVDHLSVAEPLDAEPKKRWKETICQALEGLAALGDSKAKTAIAPLQVHASDEIRKAAADALAGFLDASAVDLLQRAMKDTKPEVRAAAALGLAQAGDSSAMPIVLDSLSNDEKFAPGYFIACVVYGSAVERRLHSIVDGKSSEIGKAAQMVLLARDMLDHNGSPQRSLASLAAITPRSRLMAARAVQAFGNDEAMLEVIRQVLNGRGGTLWTVSDNDIRELMQLVVFASPPIQSRVLSVVHGLFAEIKQEVWQLQWNGLRDRLNRDGSLERAVKASKAGNKNLSQNPLIPSPSPAKGRREQGNGDDDKISSAELESIALGTYVTLVREQGNSNRRSSAFGSSVIPVCLAAMRQMLAMAQGEAQGTGKKLKPEVVSIIQPVFIHACTDPDQAVRLLAFEMLDAIGVDADTRAFIAIDSGFTDVATLGLQLLTKDAKLESAKRILTDVIVNQSTSSSQANRIILSREALKLLAVRTSPVEAAIVGLNASESRVRTESVATLVEHYEQKDAQKELVAALNSKNSEVRAAAAFGLAGKRDSRCLEALFEYSREKNSTAIGALKNLGDERAADMALKMLENDAEKKLDVNGLLDLISSFRQPRFADRLLAMMDNGSRRNGAAEALLRISGFDQSIDDFEDDRTDKSWLITQFSRHDEVLAKLLGRCLALGWWPKNVQMLLRGARWSQSAAVDPVLQQLSLLPDDTLRRSAVEAMGWRIRKRSGPAEPMVAALQHRDPETKFIAANALALAKRPEGIQILMSAVELLSDLNQRKSAVRALGELAHPVSVDFLLKIASDDQHALQESAAEAIGHFGSSPESEKVLEILRRCIANKGSSAYSAVVGLRHFNSSDSWKLIRETTASDDSPIRAHAILQLQYNDDPASRDLLLNILKTSLDWKSYLDGAWMLFGKESIEPDLAVLQNNYLLYDEPLFHCIERVCKSPDVDKVALVAPYFQPEVRQSVISLLLARESLPTEAAKSLLQGSKPAEIETAAHILARSGDEKYAKALGGCLDQWLKKLDEANARKSADNDALRDAIFKSFERLIWACSLTGAAKPALIELALREGTEPSVTALRLASIRVLPNLKLSAKDLEMLTPLLTDPVAEIRAWGAELLSGQKEKQEIEQCRSSDRDLFEIAARVDSAWKSSPGKTTVSVWQVAGADLHRQAIVAQALIATGQMESIAKVAHDSALDDSARLGAVEMLSRIPTVDARKQIEKFATASGNDEELRKAAWRALGRQKRLLASQK